MRRWMLLGAVALWLPGCAGVAAQSRVRQLTRRVEELTQQQRDAQARHEEMENRILLLTDQIESQRVAQGRRGSVELPVVTLRPETVPQEGAARVEPPVEFSGAARSDQPDRVRPMLRAEGEHFAAAVPHPAEEPPVLAEARRLPVQRRARTTPAAPPAAAPIPPSGDNLGVVPLPRIGAALSGLAARPRPAPAGAIQLASAPAGKPADAGGEPLQIYRTAQDHLRAGRFDQAERDLREFVRRFPRHDYADNAQYWLGETFYARKTYSEAATAFRAVVERWPSGNKAPDALLKLGFSLLLLGDTQKGRSVLSQVVDHYPNTDAARLADRRLTDLKEGK